MAYKKCTLLSQILFSQICLLDICQKCLIAFLNGGKTYQIRKTHILSDIQNNQCKVSLSQTVKKTVSIINYLGYL